MALARPQPQYGKGGRTVSSAAGASKMISSPTIETIQAAGVSHGAWPLGVVLASGRNEPSSLESETVDVSRPITLLQPGRIIFGNGSVSSMVEELVRRGRRKLFVVTSSNVRESCGAVLEQMFSAGLEITVYDRINSEPTVSAFADCLRAARQQPLDGVIGLGGGSPMDVAKLIAALAAPDAPSVEDVFGINLLPGRALFLACLPTTAGTGSEVSPNAILLDEAIHLKKGVISPHLVPDVACVDPLLTCSVPPAVTAATGLDALTHCIEAYANRYAHPLIDLYALQGIRLISRHLLAAVADGNDTAARAQVALGSLYGGLCLGPVNTAAVHALAYPLGSEFHVAHGISNAVLLPHVLRFNLPLATERYAEVALALGALAAGTAKDTAIRGIVQLSKLMARCPIPTRLSELGVPKDALPRLAAAAMTVTRLMKNNPRTMTQADALSIYESAW